MAFDLDEILKNQSGTNTNINEKTFDINELLEEEKKPSIISQPEKKSDDRNESLEPEAEDYSNISALTAATAGIISGLIKVPEGVVSLAADLIDLGHGSKSKFNLCRYVCGCSKQFLENQLCEVQTAVGPVLVPAHPRFWFAVPHYQSQEQRFTGMF